MKIQKTKFLNIKFKFVYSTFCCVLEFKTFEFRLRFFFSIVRYMSSVLIFFFFLIFYFFDLKFYSLFKTYLLEYITIEMYNFSLKIFWFIILMLILIFIIIKYRSGTKAEFIRFFIVLFYHRLNFLINFIILLVILPITPYEFFEYNFLIILLFSFFSIYRIIGKFFKKREQKKLIKNKSISFTLIHYLS